MECSRGVSSKLCLRVSCRKHLCGKYCVSKWTLSQDGQVNSICSLHLQGNHIYTSGATGTNAAVIKGALKAEQPQLLTVILPQSRSKQPQESRELLEQVCHCMKQQHCEQRAGQLLWRTIGIVAQSEICSSAECAVKLIERPKDASPCSCTASGVCLRQQHMCTESQTQSTKVSRRQD